MKASAPLAASVPLEQEVNWLYELQKNSRHGEAARRAESLLTQFPENRDLLLAAATSYRHLMRIPEALRILDRLERLQPRFSLLHQERGLCCVALKDAPRAIEALLRAVNLNPALPLSWRMLEGVYRLSGDDANAATAAAHVVTLKGLPAEVVRATSLFFDGEVPPAEQIIRGFLLRHGNHPEAMRLLAKIGIARDILDDAEVLLESVLELAPDYRAARYDYAEVLAKRQKFLQAREQIELLLRQESSNRDYRSLAATIAVGLGEQDRAIALYRDLLAETPDSPDVNLWLGHALKTVGRVPEAIAAYHAASAARPDFGDAYWSLANLKTYRFPNNEITRMRTAEAAPSTSLADRCHLCFALGKALEDRGEIGESWTWYANGNALKREDSRYRAETVETNTRNQIAVCTRDFFRQRTSWGNPAPDPIFIVGLPRSGSTLIEQILASHPKVEGTQELPYVQRIVFELQGRDSEDHQSRYPAGLAQMSRDDFQRLGDKYLSDAKVHRTSRPFFIDKMPNNFRHIGLIHLMLPNARIIDARREPMACCFSNLKQLFAQGQEFTYSIEDIARYYRTYLELMRHWDDALSGCVLRVHHEDVVGDLEGSVRRLLDYCGLEFEPACVAFHRTRRSVRTPSSEQVRQPIFSEGVDHWKKYEKWLSPLKIALGDALTRYRDQPVLQ